MNVWLIVYGVLIVALIATILFKSALQPRYAVVLNGLTALLIAACLAQWLTEGATAWTLAVEAIAVVLSVFAVLKAYREERAPRLS